MTYVPADHAPPMWEHQRRAFEESAHLKMYALWWEMRTGKSRVIIDTAAYQYEAGVINALTIGAYPSNVHRNWVDREIPAYLPRRIPYRAVAWRSASSAAWYDELDELLAFRGLAILTWNCEALTQSRTLWPYLQKFMHKRKCMAVADESSWLATPSAKRTVRAEAVGRRAVVRRICEGTPVDESPFDAYSQCHFLERGILGYTSAVAFRARYGDYEVEVDATGAPVLDEIGVPVRKKSWNRKTGSQFEVLKGYRNVDELQQKLLSFGSRVRRADCADLPEKIYEKVEFDLEPAQRRAYDEMRDEFRTVLETGTVTAANALVRLGRLSMVARGYWPEEKVTDPCDDCGGVGCDACLGMGVIVTRAPRVLIPATKNPAVEALTDRLDALRGAPAIVWARFHWDVVDCLEAARRLKRRAVRYDGTVPAEARRRALKAFQDGEIDLFVGTAQVGGRGIDLRRAEAIVYYSNQFSLRVRRQSEDRAESLVATRGTAIVDLIARNTVDDRIVDVLRSKRSIAADVMGDPKMEWL